MNEKKFSLLDGNYQKQEEKLLFVKNKLKIANDENFANMEKVYKFEELNKNLLNDKNNLEKSLKDLTNNKLNNNDDDDLSLENKNMNKINNEKITFQQEKDKFQNISKEIEINSNLEKNKEAPECKTQETKENLIHQEDQLIKQENSNNILKFERKFSKPLEIKEKNDTKPKRVDKPKATKNKLGIDQFNVININSSAPEKKICRQISENNLKIPVPRLNIPQLQLDEDRLDSISTNNTPILSYKLLIQESEPQECNPKENYFVKSGVHSRRQSEIIEMLKPKKENIENEIDKEITEKLKNGEDFDAICKLMNLRSTND